MATFKIYDAAGKGAYVPYANSMIRDITGTNEWSAKIADDGDWAVFDGYPVDTAINYDFKSTDMWGTTMYHVTELAFGYGALVGEIEGVDMNAVSYKSGNGALNDKVVNSGDDSFEGNNYSDFIHGGAGNDDIIGYSGDDFLFGDDGDDVFVGGAGDDVIAGGSGADVAAYTGGISDYLIIWHTEGDLFVVDMKADEGSDWVLDSTEYLSFHGSPLVDTFNSGWFGSTFTGSDGDDLADATIGTTNIMVGGAGDDYFMSRAGKDILKGDLGDDYLDGGDGADVLYGGKGIDSFVFSTSAKSGKDTIKDFNIRDDFIFLENAHFRVGGGLSSSEFRVNTTGKAQDRNDKIIYDKDSGVLYYDADGTGSKAGVAFTTIKKGLSLHYYDFGVI